ncbi:MAG: peroxiredoxin family protein [Leptospira bouyouniensis]
MNLKDWFMMQFDGSVDPSIQTLPLDTKVKDWELILTSNQKIRISDIIQRGPLLLVFIRGTWCPFCQIHLKNLSEWATSLNEKEGNVIVVSTEPIHVLKSWLNINPMNFIFASDSTLELSQYFGVRIQPNDFAQAATFLIDSNFTIRLAYKGKRTQRHFDEVETVMKKQVYGLKG